MNRVSTYLLFIIITLLIKSIIYPMYSQEQAKRRVKVRIGSNIKLFQVENFQQLKKKFVASFHLIKNRYYHLYFLNRQSQKITISSEEDFQHHSPLPTLFLEQTQDRSLHFQNLPRNFSSREHVNEQLLLLRKGLEMMIQQRTKEIRRQILENAEYQIGKVMGKKEGKKLSNVIHHGFKCCNCQDLEDIRGARYECAICDYNICEQCQEKGHKHDSTHPFVKIKDQTQMLSHKSNKLRTKSKLKQEQILSVDPKDLQQWTGMSMEQAIQFIKKNPNKSIIQLVSMFQG